MPAVGYFRVSRLDRSARLLTNAFRKTVANHAAASTLYFMYYSFGRIHQTLRVTPAMEAGIANQVEHRGNRRATWLALWQL
jgi:hypothetical protein